MCGIVGAITKDRSNEIVLDGLRRLEYRGYDSCGIFYKTNGVYKLEKSIKRVQDLNLLKGDKSNFSIGHTRWATHGKVTVKNAHPHISFDNNLVMVHNGVIENFKDLKEKYCTNIEFKSQTDTEVILEVLNQFYIKYKDLKKAIVKFIEVVQGSYACIIYNKDDKKIYALRNKSPLVIGKNDELITISSDVTAVYDKKLEFLNLEDKTFAVVQEDLHIELYDQNLEKKDLKFKTIKIDFEEVTTQEYDTFMLKEIHEQPKALKNLIQTYENINFDTKMLEDFKNSSKIYIIASGTSYNSGLATKRYIEKKIKKSVECAIGSEFGYDENLIEDNSIFIFLSQSGETADSLLVLNQIKGRYKTVAITNALGSQIDQICDYSLLLCAGVEMSVASTKAYTAQIAMIIILVNEVIGNREIYKDLLKVCEVEEKILSQKDEIEKLADKVIKYKQILYLGRLLDNELAKEAALKLKEITYINVNSIASGELKHGTISLVDDTILSIFIITDQKINMQTRSNIEEVKARGGEVIVISNTNTCKDQDNFVIDTQGVKKELNMLYSIIPHQLLAYFSALKLGLDIDKPRNLAKSVTVE